MPHTPRVTVVVPCRDDEDFLRPCLEALAAQTRPADRIVVVDNASSDASAAVAREFGADVVREELVGVWPAAARGYDEAIGLPASADVAGRPADIIARLDADSRPHSDWISRIVATMADPSVGVVTGGSQFYGAGRLTQYLGDHWYIGGGRVWIKIFLGIPLVYGSNFAMRAEVWRRVRERVDRTNARIHDDLDLTIRLRESDGIRYDADLRMPVSARPLTTQRGLWRRVWRVVPTFAASWPEGARWNRDWRPDDAGAAPEPWAEADGDEGDEDWSPRYGG